MPTLRLLKNDGGKCVPQEHPLGCAVACLASRCDLSYQQALELFEIKDFAWTRGFYCSEVVKALAKMNLHYTFEEFNSFKHSDQMKKPGTIVFISPNSKYPSGHFLLRLEEGWMNPWSNFPQMIPVEAAIEKTLPGEISYLVFPHPGSESARSVLTPPSGNSG